LTETRNLSSLFFGLILAIGIAFSGCNNDVDFPKIQASSPNGCWTSECVAYFDVGQKTASGNTCLGNSLWRLNDGRTYQGPTNCKKSFSNMDDLLRDRSSGQSPLIGLRSCISSASFHSGIPEVVFYAIPVVEGNWSASPVQTKFNNLYSIKGQGGVSETWECYDSLEGLSCDILFNPGHPDNRCGNRYHCETTESFRKYGDRCSSVEDFAETITTSERFRDCPRGNPGILVDCLQRNGYATDPNWSARVKRIINEIQQFLR
jgi:hypothetical protein